MNNDNRIKENEFSYDELIQIKEHARQYEFVNDKRTFLKNLIPYEQKLILLNSTKPYEVLSYLDTLEHKNTELIINSLNYDEIKKILNLFSMEDKEKFYNNFPHLELVNQFIKYDKYSKEYVEDLTFDRKIDLLNKSNNKTIEATEKIYSSLSDNEKFVLEGRDISASGMSALHNSTNYNENIADINISNETEENITEENLVQENEINDMLEEDNKEQSNNIKDELSKFDPNSEKFNIQDIPELDKDVLVNNPTEQKIEFKSVLPKIKTPEEILDEFNKVAVETEKKEIEIIKANVLKNKIELPKINLTEISVQPLDLPKTIQK